MDREPVYNEAMSRKRLPTSELPVDTIGTQVLSVRLPSLEMRRALTARCEQDQISVAAFVTMAVEAYLDDRLRIIEKPAAPKPSFLISADAADPVDPAD
jgi:hypothetical protein